MTQQYMDSSPPQRFGVDRVAWWLLVVVSFAMLLFLIVSEVIRFSTPGQLHRLQILQDIPLPDALLDPHLKSRKLLGVFPTHNGSAPSVRRFPASTQTNMR